MKNFLVIASLVVLVNCTSENGEDVGVDCAASDLSLQVVSRTLPGCQTAGSFEVSATGGDGVYEYTIRNQNFQPSGVFTELSSGVYNVVVRDGTGCESTLEVNLTGTEAISVSLQTEGCGDNDGSIIVSATGGDGNYEYSLNNGPFQQENIFADLSSGNYSVIVRDGSDCETRSSTVKLGVSLTADVMPIIQSECATNGCHGNSQSPLLSDEQSVIVAADRIKARVVAGTMPPTGSLSDSEIQAIADWVDCGAPNN
jgi:hypothetical protein